MNTRSPTSILELQEVQDQAILPMRVAFGICIQGIATRLGRSVVTFSGVALGIAFLMSVLAGFHIRFAMKADTDQAREVARRVAVLRGEVGILEGKRVTVVAGECAPVDLALAEALADEGVALDVAAGSLPVTAPAAEGSVGSQARTALLLGDYEPLLTEQVVGALSENRVAVFDEPSERAREALEARGLSVRSLALKLRDEEIASLRRRERDARYRMYWIVIVSLLITVGGITNAMLMSVTERFREIATMKCLGALSTFVVKLFLIESSLVGFAGAVVGVLIGGVFPLLAYSVSFSVGRVMAAVNLGVLGGYGAACIVVGVILAMVAGLYPARVAAGMVPAAALRSHV